MLHALLPHIHQFGHFNETYKTQLWKSSLRNFLSILKLASFDVRRLSSATCS
jgi:hypothetical protein